MFKSSNRYEILNTNVRVNDVYFDDMEQSNQGGMRNNDHQIKTQLPPPIYIRHSENFKLIADEFYK